MIRTVVKLIVFFAICAVFTGYLAFTIGNIHLFEHTYGLTAHFDDVTGLLPDDNVKVAGVVVGKVRKISIDQGRAKVRFTVRSSTKLPTDSQAAIRWRNLLGNRYVYVYPGTASTVLRDGDSIDKTRSVVDIGELFNRLGPVINAVDPNEVNTFLDSVVGALDGNQDKLRRSLDDLASVATSLGSRDEAIGRLVTNLDTVTGAVADRDAQIRTVLDNLLAIAQTFSSNTGTLNSAVTDLGDFSDQVGTLVDNNRGQIDSILSNLVKITDLVRAKLPTLDHALGNLDDTARALFNSSRFGEWLNQVIPCGSIGGVVNVNDPCVTDAQSLGLPVGSTATAAGAPAAPRMPGPSRPPAGGVAGLTQLLSP
jgi:phospholipid/cholesterol/gamma-HCH transport system substrate-binding protein